MINYRTPKGWLLLNYTPKRVGLSFILKTFNYTAEMLFHWGIEIVLICWTLMIRKYKPESILDGRYQIDNKNIIHSIN